MTRLIKLCSLAGLASVYLMNAPCSYTAGGGLSVIPNLSTWIGNPFKNLLT